MRELMWARKYQSVNSERSACSNLHNIIKNVCSEMESYWDNMISYRKIVVLESFHDNTWQQQTPSLILKLVSCTGSGVERNELL